MKENISNQISAMTAASFAKMNGYHPSMSQLWIKKFHFPAENIDGRWYVSDINKANEFMKWYKESRQRRR